MTVELTCQGCRTPLRVPDDMSGKRARCARCGATLTIPSATEHFWPPGAKPAAAAAPQCAAPPHQPSTPGPTATSPTPRAVQGVPAPLATPVGIASEPGVTNDAPLAIPLAEAAAAPDTRSVRDTVSIGRGASTRDTLPDPTARSGSRPIAVDRREAAPEFRGPQGLRLGDVLSRARGIFKSHLTAFALTGFAYLLVGGLASAALASGLRLVRAPLILQFLGPQAILVWLTVGMIRVTVRAARGRDASLKTLLSGMPWFPAALAVWMLCFAPLAAISLGLDTAGATPRVVAAVTAGLWLAVYFCQWIPSLVALVDHEPRPIAAWFRAAQFTARHLPLTIGMFFVSCIVLLAGVLPAGLLLPLAVPYVLLMITVAYLRSRATKP